MRNLLIIALAILSSCTCHQMMNRVHTRCPEMIKKDTIIIHDTIVYHDTLYIKGSVVSASMEKDSLDKGDTLKAENDDVEVDVFEKTDSATGKKEVVVNAKSKPKVIYRDIRVPYYKKIPVEVPCDCTSPAFYKEWWFWALLISVLLNVFLGWIIKRQR